MNLKIETLKKRAWVLYGGQDGLDAVNREVSKFGFGEEGLTPKQESILVNNIVKNVFVAKVGIEKARAALKVDVKDVRGYPSDQPPTQLEHAKINEETNFKFMVMLLLLVAIAGVGAMALFYFSVFNPSKVCEGKTGIERDNCFQLLGMTEKNATFCGKLSTPVKRYGCLSTVAVALNDSMMCEEIPVNPKELAEIKYRCMMCIAFKKRDTRKCIALEDPIRIEDCYKQIERGMSLAC